MPFAAGDNEALLGTRGVGIELVAAMGFCVTCVHAEGAGRLEGLWGLDCFVVPDLHSA